MAQTKKEAPYHHGELREALITAGRALLEEKGLRGFTLRECARRAGVSHAAPAHHFASLNDLLAGRLDYLTDQISTALPQVQAGAVKGLATLGVEAMPLSSAEFDAQVKKEFVTYTSFAKAAGLTPAN